MKIRNNRLRVAISIIEKLGKTRAPLARLVLARMKSELSELLLQYEFATRSSPEFLAYESAKDKLLERFGILVGVDRQGRRSFKMPPSNKEKYEVALERLTTESADVILAEHRRATDIVKAGEVEVDVNIREGSISYEWLKEYVDANDIFELIDLGLLSEERVDAAIRSLGGLKEDSRDKKNDVGGSEPMSN